MPLKTAKTIALWPVRQLIGFLRNVWAFLRGLNLRDVLAPAVVSSLVWLREQVPRAFGLRSAGQQVSASLVLGVATFFTGAVTGGAAWAIIGLWVLTLGVGIARFVPAVDYYWPLGGQ